MRVALQLNMICTCGAVLPVDSRYSICDRCMEDDEELQRDFILEQQELEDFENIPFEREDIDYE